MLDLGGGVEGDNGHIAALGHHVAQQLLQQHFPSDSIFDFLITGCAIILSESDVLDFLMQFSRYARMCFTQSSILIPKNPTFYVHQY